MFFSVNSEISFGYKAIDDTEYILTEVDTSSLESGLTLSFKELTNLKKGTAAPLFLRDGTRPYPIGSTFFQPVLAKTLQRLAKAGVEAAVWDALAKANDMRLVDYFASFLPGEPQVKDHASVGVSIGIQPSVEETTAIIRKRLDQGGHVRSEGRLELHPLLCHRVREPQQRKTALAWRAARPGVGGRTCCRRRTVRCAAARWPGPPARARGSAVSTV